MKKYKQKQIDEFLFYLGYSVKKGYLEPEVALDIIEEKDWELVEEMMITGDVFANTES